MLEESTLLSMQFSRLNMDNVGSYRRNEICKSDFHHRETASKSSFPLYPTQNRKYQCFPSFDAPTMTLELAQLHTELQISVRLVLSFCHVFLQSQQHDYRTKISVAAFQHCADRADKNQAPKCWNRCTSSINHHDRKPDEIPFHDMQALCLHLREAFLFAQHWSWKRQLRALIPNLRAFPSPATPPCSLYPGNLPNLEAISRRRRGTQTTPESEASKSQRNRHLILSRFRGRPPPLGHDEYPIACRQL